MGGLGRLSRDAAKRAAGGEDMTTPSVRLRTVWQTSRTVKSLREGRDEPPSQKVGGGKRDSQSPWMGGG